jgi:hypothetical protein
MFIGHRMHYALQTSLLPQFSATSGCRQAVLWSTDSRLSHAANYRITTPAGILVQPCAGNAIHLRVLQRIILAGYVSGADFHRRLVALCPIGAFLVFDRLSFDRLPIVSSISAGISWRISYLRAIPTLSRFVRISRTHQEILPSRPRLRAPSGLPLSRVARVFRKLLAGKTQSPVQTGLKSRRGFCRSTVIGS